MADIAIVFMGFINQHITGGHHPVAVLKVSLVTILISLPTLYGKLIGREMPSFGVPIIMKVGMLSELSELNSLPFNIKIAV